MKKNSRRVVAILLVVLLIGLMPAAAAAAQRVMLLNAAAVGGGRRDIHLGARNTVIVLEVQIPQETRVMFFDHAYNEIGAMSYQATGPLMGGFVWNAPGHKINCFPAVRHVAFFLDDDKRAVVYKIDEW